MIKTEFKHLDALRGVMAIYITVVHFKIFFYFNKTKQFDLARFAAIFELGQIFMTVFFVLSGFLITYILLSEKERNQTINFKRFYLRRAFRILPMYYLAIILMYYLYSGVCQHPDIYNYKLCNELTERTSYYVFMIPNWALVIDKSLPHISNFWSIGAEEQFYLAWPFVLLFSRNYLRTFFTIYLVYCFLLITSYILRWHYDGNEFFLHIAKIVDSTRFGAFAFGGCIAYISLSYKDIDFTQKIHAFITKKRIQWVCLILPFIINFIPNEHVVFLKHIIVIPCCAVVIYNLAMNEQVIFKIDNKILNYLGKITYSVYILNQIVIDIAIKICFGAKIHEKLIIFLFSMISLFVLSMISYHLIEKPFMKLRRRFG